MSKIRFMLIDCCVALQIEDKKVLTDEYNYDDDDEYYYDDDEVGDDYDDEYYDDAKRSKRGADE